MEISHNKLVVALRRGLEEGFTDPANLAAYVAGYADLGASTADTAEVPKVGDLVQVREGARGYDNTGHRICEGLTGTLGTHNGSGGYSIPGYFGPLSDFEKVGA